MIGGRKKRGRGDGGGVGGKAVRSRSHDDGVDHGQNAARSGSEVPWSRSAPPATALSYRGGSRRLTLARG